MMFGFRLKNLKKIEQCAVELDREGKDFFVCLFGRGDKIAVS